MSREQHAEEQVAATRAEILHHAHRLFSHYGYWKTSIGDIAKCCGMSPGNLYRYFRNKQAIGLASVEQYFREVEQAMESAFEQPGGTPEARIRAALCTGVAHLLAEFDRNPRMVELAEFLCSDAEGLEVLGRHIAWKRERIARELSCGMKDGTIAHADAEKTAGIMLNALKAFWNPTTLALWRDRTTVVPELEEILDLMFRGLRG